MSRFKIGGLIVTAAVALLLAGCNNTANENANVNGNANTNANAPVVASNTNANANANRRIVPTREEYEKNKEKYQKEAKDTGRKIGTGISDGWLWVKTRYDRSEEHTSELQSPCNLVCRLLLEKKKKKK